jgi:hypothetical protein
MSAKKKTDATVEKPVTDHTPPPTESSAGLGSGGEAENKADTSSAPEAGDEARVTSAMTEAEIFGEGPEPQRTRRPEAPSVTFEPGTGSTRRCAPPPHGCGKAMPVNAVACPRCMPAARKTSDGVTHEVLPARYR